MNRSLLALSMVVTTMTVPLNGCVTAQLWKSVTPSDRLGTAVSSVEAGIVQPEVINLCVSYADGTERHAQWSYREGSLDWDSEAFARAQLTPVARANNETDYVHGSVVVRGEKPLGVFHTESYVFYNDGCKLWWAWIRPVDGSGTASRILLASLGVVATPLALAVDLCTAHLQLLGFVLARESSMH